MDGWMQDGEGKGRSFLSLPCLVGAEQGPRVPVQQLQQPRDATPATNNAIQIQVNEMCRWTCVCMCASSIQTALSHARVVLQRPQLAQTPLRLLAPALQGVWWLLLLLLFVRNESPGW